MAKTAKKKAAKPRKANAAFMKPVTRARAGGGRWREADTAYRGHQELWAYIKKNGLQDKTNKRMIKSDDNLKAIFKKPTVNMFEMTKLVSKHLS